MTPTRHIVERERRRPHRRRRHRPIDLAAVARPAAEINVTPLIDVVLVLLIIFMVITPLEEENMDVRLTAEKTTDEPTRIAKEQILVTVRVDSLTINDAPVARDAYLASLKGIMDERDPQDRIVFVAASDSTPYASLMEVIDAARRAGAENVGLVTEHTPEDEAQERSEAEEQR